MVEPMKLVRCLLLLASTLALASCARSAVVPVYGARVVASYSHDPAAFTEGLCFAGGVLYEGTGLESQSTLRRVDLKSGRVQQERPLSPDLFGEGIAAYQDKVVQLTWRSHVGFVYDRQTFSPIRQFSYQTEGWGITWDGHRLIMSDGTARLYFLDPATLEVTGSVEVRMPDGGQPVTGLNELEYVKGEVYANLWPTDRIVRIVPATGRVVGWIDLAGLLGPEYRDRPVDVLNGIAYDAKTDRLFVTGKLWPRLFQISLVRR